MDFRDRAQFEAERYGADPWIFVRELLQNARDAGATYVNIDVAVRDEQVRLTCRDNGDGMTEEHAKKFLFRLYASSKEGAAGMAGRFGVGFWSILRFEPATIAIRSWPRRGKPWEVLLDGKLEHAAAGEVQPGPRGTEIVLTRRLVPYVGEQVKAAARAHARYLMTRADPTVPLDVVIDGERITEELSLPAPSATFQKRGVRGVVALGAKPHVELFSKGLHVRTTASVDELLAAPDEKGGQSRQLDPLLEGLAPQVILDGDQLNLVRSRSDARDDKALRRAVELSRKELARLIERQLAFSRPVPLWKRMLRPALAVVATCAFLGGGGWLLSSVLRTAPARQVTYAAPAPPVQPQEPARPAAEPYRDPSNSYGGPRTDALPKQTRVTDITYVPSTRALHLASLHISSPDEVTRLRADDVQQDYPTRACTKSCVRMGMTVDAVPGWLRLPIASGYVLDRETLTVNGERQHVFRTAQGEPVLWVERVQRMNVAYRIGPGSLPGLPAEPKPDLLPAGAPNIWAVDTVAERVGLLRDWVAENVEYTNDPSVGRLNRGTRATEFVERTLQIGAGDCDVQNMVLAQLLQRSGIPARVAVGYLGRHGRAEPLLHAWVEYYNNGWMVTDASAPAAAPVVAGVVPAAPPPVMEPRAGPVAVGLRAPEPAPAVASPRAEPHSGFHITLPRVEVPKPALGLIGAAPLLALALLFLRPRVRRQLQLDEHHDVSRLLQGALARPEAFSHVPALFDLPLVPRRGGAPISLGHAYELAAQEKLYSSDVGAPFTERSVKAGAVVLDAMRPEGRVVAEALGAVNLDRWDRLLRLAKIPPLLEKVNAHLASRGERWTLMVSDAVVSEPAVLSVPGTKADKWVVINGDAQWLPRAAVLSATRPSRALFEVIDHAALWLRMPSARRARLLAPLAKAAVHEELKGDAPPAAPAVEQQRVETFDDAAQPVAEPKDKISS